MPAMASGYAADCRPDWPLESFTAHDDLVLCAPRPTAFPSGIAADSQGAMWVVAFDPHQVLLPVVTNTIIPMSHLLGDSPLTLNR